MKHYLKTLEETIRQQWDQKSLCDYEGDSFTYADVALPYTVGYGMTEA